MEESEMSSMQALRAYGATSEEWLATTMSNAKQDALTAEDVKCLAIFAYLQYLELKQRLDDYETRGAHEWMSVTQAMNEAGCSKRTIFRAISSGELRSKKVNGRRVIERQSLDMFAQCRSL